MLIKKGFATFDLANMALGAIGLLLFSKYLDTSMYADAILCVSYINVILLLTRGGFISVINARILKSKDTGFFKTYAGLQKIPLKKSFIASMILTVILTFHGFDFISLCLIFSAAFFYSFNYFFIEGLRILRDIKYFTLILIFPKIIALLALYYLQYDSAVLIMFYSLGGMMCCIIFLIFSRDSQYLNVCEAQAFSNEEKMYGSKVNVSNILDQSITDIIPIFLYNFSRDSLVIIFKVVFSILSIATIPSRFMALNLMDGLIARKERILYFLKVNTSYIAYFVLSVAFSFFWFEEFGIGGFVVIALTGIGILCQINYQLFGLEAERRANSTIIFAASRNSLITACMFLAITFLINPEYAILFSFAASRFTHFFTYFQDQIT